MSSQRRHSQKGNFLISTILLALLPAFTLVALAADKEESPNGVARAIFTSKIIDHEPVDELNSVPATQSRIYFFSDLRGLEGQIISHRWEYRDKVMAEVKFQVGGPRWRVYSSKNLLPEWTGEWTVVVTDASGKPIKTSVFKYGEVKAQ